MGRKTIRFPNKVAGFVGKPGDGGHLHTFELKWSEER
jgi:hypothetical protein